MTKKTNYPKGKEWDHSRPADEIYEYRDAQNQYLYEGQRQGRGENKAYRIGRTNHLRYGDRHEPDDNWQWKDSRGDLPSVLYLLPQLLQADKTATVWITEGERDADLLAKLGQIATTNPYGFGAWLEEHGETLAGRHVIICEDNDSYGRKRTEIVRKTLGKAASVSIVRFEDMKVGSDAGDFLDAGNTLDDLLARVETTLPIVIGNLSETVDQIEDRLIGAGVEIYGRSDSLVRPITTDQGESLLITVTVHDLRDIISKHCEFRKFNAKGDLVAGAATLDFAQTLLARVGRWRFSEINGIHTAPIVQEDGSVLDTPGYDEATGLYLILPGKVEIGTTREEAEFAIKALCDDLLIDFPKVSQTDLAVMLSGLLTPLVRPVIDAAPAHCIRAHTPGTGKSYYLDCASMLALGTKSTGLTLAQGDEDENRKLLSAVAMTGTPVISIDNVNGEIKGDFLCQLIERPSVQPRILGKSEAPRIQNVFCVYCNGNNMFVAGDLTRRVLLCNLDSGLERPETRRFKNDPVALIKTNREKYLGYALTIVRAYLASGERVKVRAFNSFGRWSKMAREPIVWLGYSDPCDSIEAVRNDDPDRVAIQSLFAAWPKLDVGYDAGQLIAASVVSSPTGPSDDTALRRALILVAGDNRDEIGKRKLGKYLSSIKKRPVDGRYLDVRQDSHLKTNTYHLRQVAA